MKIHTNGKVLGELIKAKENIQRKYSELKHGKAEIHSLVSGTLSPIIEPLNDLKNYKPLQVQSTSVPPTQEADDYQDFEITDWFKSYDIDKTSGSKINTNGNIITVLITIMNGVRVEVVDEGCGESAGSGEAVRCGGSVGSGDAVSESPFSYYLQCICEPDGINTPLYTDTNYYTHNSSVALYKLAGIQNTGIYGGATGYFRLSLVVPPILYSRRSTPLITDNDLVEDRPHKVSDYAVDILTQNITATPLRRKRLRYRR
ncbi:Uncharacterized protein FWK35_00011193 [Aphis craccivora]|uniref:Uncharacterized protein n=1 Tax=Aphis craccivora TaxID=307492 RepID=A0A6G0Y8D3_APHCR|nr:Uncharacterized protein FWK35_00011193 [Aphis craccivora]